MPPLNFAIRSADATDVGSVRKLNEDSCLNRPDIGLWVVADGMGGHEAGEVASGLIVDRLNAIRPPSDGVAFIGEVRATLDAVNAELIEEAGRRGGGMVIGSTVVALLAFGAGFACLWAGDSRLYRLRDGVLDQLTRDHSQVQDMVDAGLLAPEAAEHHPYANVVTRAVGADSGLELDKVKDRIEPGDLFLLCTDGLSKMVGEEEIAAILNATAAEAAPAALVAAALAHGGKDNVTAVVVRFDAFG